MFIRYLYRLFNGGQIDFLIPFNEHIKIICKLVQLRIIQRKAFTLKCIGQNCFHTCDSS